MTVDVTMPQRGWLNRQESSKKRQMKSAAMADINAVRRAAMFGEAPPADALARLEAAETQRLVARGLAPAPVAPESAISQPQEPGASASETVTRKVGRPRKDA